MSGFEEIAQQFTKYYYEVFDSNRESLAPLYRNHSMLTFEQTSLQGSANIIEKLVGFPFKKIQHRVDTLDAQPSNETGGILVCVTGALLVDEEQKPMAYTQVFQLLPEGETYYIFNDVFRLIYSAS